jgi:hypothetical protein
MPDKMEKKENVFMQLQVIYIALLAGMLLFGGISVFLVHIQIAGLTNSTLEKPLQIIALLMAVISVGMAFTLFNKRILQIAPDANAGERISAYRSAAIMRWAFVEGPALFSIVCFLLTGKYLFLALTGILILVFTATAPVKTKIIQQLQLDDTETGELEDRSE